MKQKTYRVVAFMMMAFSSWVGAETLQVSVETLKGENHSWHIIDARGSDDYAKGHIPGAINLPVGKTFNQNPPRKDLIGPVHALEKLFGDAGIGQQVPVVIYAKKIHMAARLFWILEMMGHQNVALLDGGWDAWKKSGEAIETHTPAVTPVRFEAHINKERLATKLDVLMAMEEADIQIIDSRSPDHYTGKISRSDRFGHIPTSINLPASHNLVNKDGVDYFAPLEQLRENFSGVDPAQNSITYCYKGISAATDYYVMRQLGMKASVYDGSWYEWSLDKNLPINK